MQICYCSAILLLFCVGHVRVPFFAVAIWPVTGRGVKNTKLPAVRSLTKIVKFNKCSWECNCKCPCANV